MNNKEELEKNALAVKYDIDGHEIKLTPKIVEDYIIGGNTKIQITKPEFMMFAELCRVRKLNPFLKEAYCIKYSNNTAATIVVGKDAILKRAVLHPKYNGMKSGIYVMDSNGELIKRNGTFKLPTDELVGGWAEVFRKDWEHSIEASVSLEEAVQKKSSGETNTNWTKQPATMIEKVAKVRALREAFVEDLSGMYEAEEMNIDLPEVLSEEKIIQNDENIIEAEVEEIKETPKKVQKIDSKSNLEQVDISDI